VDNDDALDASTWYADSDGDGLTDRDDSDPLVADVEDASKDGRGCSTAGKAPATDLFITLMGLLALRKRRVGGQAPTHFEQRLEAAGSAKAHPLVTAGRYEE
jgi:hypothetical protein